MPLSLVYVATPLRHDYRIKIVDQRIDKDWRNTLTKELSGNDVICAGISSMTGPQISGGLETASIIKQSKPEVPVVWGGVHPSLLPEKTIKDDMVDIVVKGDGEKTFQELVHALQAGEDKRGVKGIIYKDGKSIIKTPMREQFPLRDLGTLAYDLVEVERYKSTMLWTKRRSLPIITSRGCPHKCGYCYNTEFGHKKWTSLSPERTVTNIRYLVNTYDLSGVFLLDDNFFVDLKRAKRICETIIKSNLNIHIYNANCRADTIVRMDRELLTLIKRAGFNQLYIGVESGSDEVLDSIGKGITVGQVLLANKRLKDFGIRPFYSFMAGFPYETIEDVKKTLSLMRCLLRENPEAIVYKLQLFTPFPGTELFHLASKLGMKYPEDLKGWAQYNYDKINYDRFDAGHKKFLEDSHYYSTFLDSKINIDRTQYTKLVANLYSKFLGLRIDHACYSLMWELYPLKICQMIRRRILDTC
jgi:radical SAM superfamily enzyme YgiQ (UPF0313 family)